MKRLFIRLSYDMTNIKESSIWKISLVDENNHILYIETLHENLSDKLSEDKFLELTKESYFKGLTNIDDFIGSLNLVNSLDQTTTNKINIYVNTDKEIRNKILEYIKEFLNSEEILLVFKDSFEEILFLNFMEDSLNEVKIYGTATVENFFFDLTKKYQELSKQSVSDSLESAKDSKESYDLLNYIKIVIETLILRDLFTYIVK